MARLFYGTISLIVLLCCVSFRLSDAPFLWGVALEGFPITKEMLEGLHKEISVPPQIIAFYLSWPEPEGTGPSPLASINAIKDDNAIPCITWEPFYFVDNKKTNVSFQDILGGKYDGYLNAMASSAKTFKGPLLIRFAHEMNLEEYHWGTSVEEYNALSSERYKKMFRYVVDMFRANGVSNVMWVFCPNADSVPNVPWNNLANYYPGGEYVDVFGMDGYSWSDKEIRSFKEIFEPSYQALKKIDPNKPILVFETSISGSLQNKQRWLLQALKTAEEWKLKGIIWFQVDKEKKWKLDRSAQLIELRRLTMPSRKWVELHLN